MEAEVFENYFKKSFIPAIGTQRPVLLIYDGHSTHVGLNILEEATKENITILKLPAHTSHVLQPLDLAVMKSFKDRWDPLLVKWQRSHIGVPLPKSEFARLKIMFLLILVSQNLMLQIKPTICPLPSEMLNKIKVKFKYYQT